MIRHLNLHFVCFNYGFGQTFYSGFRYHIIDRILRLFEWSRGISLCLCIISPGLIGNEVIFLVLSTSRLSALMYINVFTQKSK